MPGMDGRQFLRRLRTSERWAAKPFSDVTLLERVRRLIGDA